MREINETILSIWILILYIAVSIPGVSAEINHCYTSGTIFGIIVLSVFATLFVIAVTLTLIWFLWTKNLLNLGKLEFISLPFESQNLEVYTLKCDHLIIISFDTTSTLMFDSYSNSRRLT